MSGGPPGLALHSKGGPHLRPAVGTGQGVRSEGTKTGRQEHVSKSTSGEDRNGWALSVESLHVT